MDEHRLLLVIAVIAIALIFDFINGFHDSANSIATIVSTRVLSPLQAVAWAAFFNFIAFTITDLKVASTIGKGILDPSAVDMAVVVGTLIGAIVWNLLTWWWGLPSSSSHALVGGLIGAGIAKAGLDGHDRRLAVGQLDADLGGEAAPGGRFLAPGRRGHGEEDGERGQRGAHVNTSPAGCPRTPR